MRKPFTIGLGLTPALCITLAALSLPTGVKAASIQMVTENYQPLNYMDDGKIVGIGPDQVKLIMKRAKLSYTLEMMPWARAYSMAQSQANTCVFNTAHTDERSPKFKWVGPLVFTRTVLIAKAGSNIHPKTIEEARQYVVGTQRADVTQDILENSGFKKIDVSANFDVQIKKLLAGRIDLVSASDGYYYGEKAKGLPIEIAYVLSSQKNSIACSLDTDDSVIKAMQNQLDSLIKDGTQAKILKKYDMEGK